MRWITPLILSCCLLLLCAQTIAGCDSGSTPVPYLVNQEFQKLDGCITDFALENGSCITITDEEIIEGCEPKESECVEHFYYTKKGNKPHFVHINARYPCYPQWLIDAYSDVESEDYLSEDYRVVGFTLSSLVVNDAVHLMEYLDQEDLQQTDYCYYRIEASIRKLQSGGYDLSLWNPDREPILKAYFETSSRKLEVRDFRYEFNGEPMED